VAVRDKRCFDATADLKLLQDVRQLRELLAGDTLST
jgi:hypothetical protein